MTRVSVIIPAFNARRWLAETLQSVEQQAFPGVETIVVDDGSTDGTADFIQSEFPQVRLVVQPNQGCSAARRRGSELAMGRYIKYLDADDLLAPGVLERQWCLAEETGADVVYGSWQRLTQSCSGEWCFGDVVDRRIEDVCADYPLAFLTDMWCTTGAYLWRRAFLQHRHPGWHGSLPVIQDARFAFDAADAGAVFVYDSAVSAYYRNHRMNSVSTRSQLAFNQDCFRNAGEIWHAWRAAGKVTPQRARAVVRLCEEFGIASIPLDRKLAYEMFEFAKEIDPAWRLCGSRLRSVLSHIFGSCLTAEVVVSVRMARLHIGRVFSFLVNENR